MRTAANPGSDAKIQRMEVGDELITAHLVDGRSISVPLSWSWRLMQAAPEQRQRHELLGEGQGIRWPELDEDISLRGMLLGTPARPGAGR